MKIRYIYALFILCSSFFLFQSNSNGAGAVQGKDRTGSPIADGSCQTCHNNGVFDPEIAISLLQNDEPVEKYIPGETYILKIEVVANAGTPDEYGFQAVALDDNNDNAGSWIVDGQIQVSTVNNREYPEHTNPSASNVFEMSWTAPAVGTGNVTFYSAGIAALNNGQSNGDNGATANLSITEDVDSQTSTPTTTSLKMEVYPNPVANYLTVTAENAASGSHQLLLTDAYGRRVWEKDWQITQQESNLSFSIADLPAGSYVVQLIGKGYQRVQLLQKL